MHCCTLRLLLNCRRSFEVNKNGGWNRRRCIVFIDWWPVCRNMNCCRQTGRTEFKFSIYNVLNKVPAKLRRAMGYWLVVFNLFEVAILHGVGEQHTWQRDQWRCQWSRLMWTWWWSCDGDSPGCSVLEGYPPYFTPRASFTFPHSSHHSILGISACSIGLLTTSYLNVSSPFLLSSVVVSTRSEVCLLSPFGHFIPFWLRLDLFSFV